MNLRVVIAEDEAPALHKLRRMLAAIPNLSVVGEARDGQAAAELIRSLRPDAAFLDIRMPLADGVSVVKSLPVPPKIVFVTAHAAYAATAFEVQAADYLLKPYTAERLTALVERLREQLRLERLGEWMRDGQQVAPDAAAGGHRLALKMGQEIVLVPTAAIECILAEGNYLHILTAKRKFFVRGVLAALEAGLQETAFFRTHRSSTVNLSQLVSVNLQTREATTRSGYRVPISRSRGPALVAQIRNLGVAIVGER